MSHYHGNAGMVNTYNLKMEELKLELFNRMDEHVSDLNFGPNQVWRKIIQWIRDGHRGEVGLSWDSNREGTYGYYLSPICFVLTNGYNRSPRSKGAP